MPQAHLLEPRALQARSLEESADAPKNHEAASTYVDIFISTYGRLPVEYREYMTCIYCGDGGFSRGARLAGCECYGFDVNTACRSRYETEPSPNGTPTPSCMRFIKADVDSDQFWRELEEGCVGDAKLPTPDIIHCSPPCASYSKAPSMKSERERPDEHTMQSIDRLIRRLRTFERHMRTTQDRHLIWQIENVPESAKYKTEPVDPSVTLCGTMMGHRVFLGSHR